MSNKGTAIAAPRRRVDMETGKLKNCKQTTINPEVSPGGKQVNSLCQRATRVK